MDEDSETTAEEERDFVATDSKHDYSVLKIQQMREVYQHVRNPKSSFKNLEIIKSATGKTKCIQVTLRANKFFLRLL